LSRPQIFFLNIGEVHKSSGGKSAKILESYHFFSRAFLRLAFHGDVWLIVPKSEESGTARSSAMQNLARLRHGIGAGVRCRAAYLSLGSYKFFVQSEVI